MTFEELVDESAKIGIILDEKQQDLLKQYATLIIEGNKRSNITAIVEPEEIYEKHFFDAIYPLIELEDEGKVTDIGTGAGVPGIVWKIIRPKYDMDLVESNGKKCTFLNEVIEALKLENIHVCNVRAEEYAQEHREESDIVVARAVAELPILLELCVPYVKVDGTFVAMKGSKGEVEIETSQNAIDEVGVVLDKVQKINLPSGDGRLNIYYKKIKPTDDKYPRDYKKIKKNPL